MPNPYGWLTPLATFEEQLSTPETPGLESEDPTEIAYDPLSSVIAPGVLDPTDVSFDALPQPDEERLKPVTSDVRRQSVIDWAKQWVDKAWYVWGGESMKEGGFDCSGLLWASFKQAGITLPRVSYAQARRGKRVSLDSLQPGDLVAWDHHGNGADHIALYIGNGQIIEAAHTGTKVRIRKVGKNEGAWGVHLNY